MTTISLDKNTIIPPHTYPTTNQTRFYFIIHSSRRNLSEPLLTLKYTVPIEGPWTNECFELQLTFQKYAHRKSAAPHRCQRPSHFWRGGFQSQNEAVLSLGAGHDVNWCERCDPRDGAVGGPDHSHRAPHSDAGGPKTGRNL